MKIYLPKDEELIEASEEYYKTGNISKFLEIGGMWVIKTAIMKYRLGEDGASEVFLLFYSKAIDCLEQYKKRKHIKFPAYLYVFTKYMIFNYVKMKRSKMEFEYVHLYIPVKNRYEDTEHNIKSKEELIMEFADSMSPFPKIIFLLRYNLPIQVQEKNMLNKILSKRGVDVDEFWEDWEKRVTLINQKNNETVERINMNFNKSVLVCNSTQSHLYKFHRNARKKLYKDIYKVDKLYSFKELGRIFGIGRNKLGSLLRKNIRSAKHKILNKSSS